MTIGNTPPYLRTVGLDQYHPVVGERVRAVAGTIQDDDGDRAAPRYQWYRDDTPVAGATGATFDVTGFTPGEQLRLEAWASDTEDGPRVVVGPVTVAADVSRWRPLRTFDEFFDAAAQTLFWDAPHERLIEMVGPEVWEYVVLPTGELRGARLAPVGSPPERAHYQMIAHDPSSQRLLLVDHRDPTLLHALDLSERGQETWSTLVTSGRAPTPTGGTPRFSTWEDLGRIWFYGTLDTSTSGEEEPALFSLDVSPPGAEAWIRHALPPEVGRAAYLSVTAMPGRPGHAYGIGGSLQDLFGDQQSLYEIDVSTTSVTIERLGPASGATVGSVLVPDRTGDGLYLIDGISSVLGRAQGRIQHYALDSGVVRTVVEDAPALAGPVIRVDDRSIDFVGQRDESSGSTRARYSFDVARGGLDVVATERIPENPTGVSRVQSDQMEVLGTSTDGWAIWTLDGATRGWIQASIAPNPIDGRSPMLRSGVRSSADNGEWVRVGSMVFGGTLMDASIADSEVWEITPETSWRTWEVSPGSVPAARTGAHVAATMCGFSIPTAVVFGGLTASRTLLGDTWVLTCSEDACTWADATGAPGTGPSARRAATLAATRDFEFVLFGGATSLGDTNEVWVFDGCGSPQWWTPTIAGTPPAPREGHSMTYVPGTPASYLIYGGTRNGSSDAPELRTVHRLTLVSRTQFRWDEVRAEGPALRLSGHSGAWDPLLRRMITVSAGQVWELRVR